MALVDVLALEAVRLFLPDVFRGLYGAIDGLTSTSDSAAGRDRRADLKKQVEELIAAAGDRAHIVRNLISRLFPAAIWHIENNHYQSDWKGRWLQERRIAHEYVVRYYLERFLGEGLQTFTEAERAWSLIDDSSALDGYLRSLEPARLQDVISSLEAYEDKFGSENVESATVILLNLLPDLPVRERGMFSVDTRVAVTRVVYRFIRSMNDPGAIASTVSRSLPLIASLFSKWELIRMVGHRENEGHKLVSQADAAEFEATWRKEVRAASAESLAGEKNLLWIFL